MNDKIHWIFFDVGGTLFDEDLANRDRYQKYAKTKRCIELGLDEKKLNQEVILASIHYLPQFKAVIQKYDLPTDIEYNADLEVPYQEAEMTLEILKRRYHLGIIANQVKGLEDRLKKFHLEQYFEVVVPSFESGYHKPDEKIFLLALEKAKVSPNECVYVGDRLDNDIIPARRLGFTTVWILQGFGKFQTPRDQASTPDYEIHSLSDLLNIF